MLVSLALASVGVITLVEVVVVDEEARCVEEDPSTCRWRRRLASSSEIHNRSRPSTVLRIEVPTSIGLGFEKLGAGDSTPFPMLVDEGRKLMKATTPSSSILCSTMMRPGERGPARPLLELVLNLLKRGAIGGQAPICRITNLSHGCETEYFRCDGPHSVVCASIRSPVSRNTPPSEGFEVSNQSQQRPVHW